MAFFNSEKYLSLRESLEAEHTNKLVEIFEQTLRQNMGRVAPLLQADDRAQIKRIAHQVYSSSALIGFDDFAAQCRKVEYEGDEMSRDTFVEECLKWSKEADLVGQKLLSLQTGSLSLSL